MNKRIAIVLILMTLAGALVAMSSTNDAASVTNLYREAHRWLKTGEFDRARILFEQALSNAPGSAVATECASRIGDCYFSEANLRNALRAYERCLRDYPHGSARFNVQVKAGDCYVHLGDLDRARQCYKEWPMIVPNVEERIRQIKKPQQSALPPAPAGPSDGAR